LKNEYLRNPVFLILELGLRILDLRNSVFLILELGLRILDLRNSVFFISGLSDTRRKDLLFASDTANLKSEIQNHKSQINTYPPAIIGIKKTSVLSGMVVLSKLGREIYFSLMRTTA